MGTDISGVIECRPWRPDAKWVAAIRLGLLTITRDYDAFGCLFGVRNFANFRPLAAGRGLPDDVSQTVRADIAEHFDDPREAIGPTWISWAELADVDWDEPAEAPDSRIHEYRQTPEGLRLVGKSAWSKAFAEAAGLSGRPGDDPGSRPDGTEWQGDGVLFRSETMTRRQAVPADGEWAQVWAVMAALAAVHGPDNVRLVVWFDN